MDLGLGNMNVKLPTKACSWRIRDFSLIIGMDRSK
jgi:hypothetical protein